MRKLLNEQKYRISIKGLTDKVSPQLCLVRAETDENALRNVVKKITHAVQDQTSPYSKDMTFDDGEFSCPLTPRYAGLLFAYLLDNPEKFKIESIR